MAIVHASHSSFSRAIGFPPTLQARGPPALSLIPCGHCGDGRLWCGEGIHLAASRLASTRCSRASVAVNRLAPAIGVTILPENPAAGPAAARNSPAAPRNILQPSLLREWRGCW